MTSQTSRQTSRTKLHEDGSTGEAPAAASQTSRDDLLRALGVKGSPEGLTESIVAAAGRKPLGYRYTLTDGKEPGLALRVSAQGGEGVWYLSFKDGTGKRWMYPLPVRHGASPPVARLAAKAVKVELSRGVNPAEKKQADRAAEKAEASKETLRAFISSEEGSEGEYWKKHLQFLKDGEGTRKRIVNAFPGLLDKVLDKITREDIESELTKRRVTDKCKASTVLREWQSLRTALGYAVEWKRIPALPTNKLPAPLRGWRPAERKRYVGEQGPEERARVASTLAVWAKRMDDGDESAHLLVFLARLAWATGMRRGEILGLRDSEVGPRVITLPAHRAKAGHDRIIRLNASAREALKLWKLRSPKGEFFPGYLDDQGVAGQMRIAWGGKLTRAWKKFCEEAQVSDLHFHDLRHTFATDLRMAGTPLEVVRDAVGHSSVKMTQRYAHVGEREVSDAVNKVSVP